MILNIVPYEITWLRSKKVWSTQRMDLTSYKLPNKSKINNERALILSDFVAKINMEREGTMFKKVTGQQIAVKLAHLSLQDLYYLFGMCLKGKSFGKVFFGSLKPK